MLLKKLIPILIGTVIMPFFLKAQITTSSISGIVKDNAGNALVGTSITATHLPTGTVYNSATRSGGRYDINNMNPGGPYTIKLSYVGFETETREDVFLTLGETQRVDVQLSNATTQLTEVTVAGRRTAGVRTGNETQISRERLAALPTVGRNLNDFVRFTPQTKITNSGGISIAGQNNRYNGFLIDGAVNNDVFGVSEQATNGGRAGVPPISIDAIDQIVVQISPYDAALGNFTGGAINAITKSGSNEFHGSAYYIFRNQDMAGKTPGPVPVNARIKLADFKNQTYGFTIGGPIIKNKAFFFINAEKQKDNRPQPFTPVNVLNADGTIRFNVVDTVTKLVNILKASPYSYDPGDYLNNPDLIDRTNINSRFDFNLNAKNKLTLSYRYTNAERINPSRSTNANINFVNGAEFFPSVTHSGNIELTTKFSNNSNNKFRASITDVVDDRNVYGTPFPNVQIVSYNGGPNLNFGSEVSSSANLLKQRILNFYDAFRIYMGKHSITLGADIDFNKSYNLFMNRNLGAYIYSSLGTGTTAITPLQAFLENRGPSRYRRGYSLVDPGNKGGDANVNSAANFKSVRLGFFANDDIKLTDKLTLTVGVRGDKTFFTTPVPVDKFFNDTARTVVAAVYDLKGAMAGTKFSPVWQFSPRVGFRYNIDEENVTLRGGFGIFGGRTPLVWPGGVYQNTGITIGGLDTARTTAQLTAAGTQYGLQIGGQPVPFRTDVNNQFTQADFGLSSSLLTPQGDLNIIAKKIHLPAVFKVSLGADKKLDKGWTISVDGLYTKNIYEVEWQNLNFGRPSVMTSGPDSRLIYSTTGNPNRFVFRPWATANAIRNPYNNIILIKNTEGQKGFAYNLTFTIDKQTRTGFIFNTSYTYGNSQVNNEATSSINTSNWTNMEANDRNALKLSTSDFDLGHRLFALVSKKITYAKGHAATTVSLVYNGQSGSPFSYSMSNRGFIGDGVTNNDLMYIPASRAEMDNMVFTQNGLLSPAQQRDQFEAYIQSDKYLRKHRGKISERNGARAPFTNILDANIEQSFSIKTADKTNHTLSVRFDIFNLTNLIDKDAGRQYFFNFDQQQVLSFEGFTTGNVPTYRFFRPANDKPGVISDGTQPYNSSRWNAQLTVRYSF
ncbi:MAG: TonB-dependent receptor [Ferruginibacter sp.]